MEWFVIFLALGVAIGPMLYLMPTDRDRHVAALRAQAKKMGYTVQLDKVLKLDPDDQERVTAGGGVRHPAVSCARYQLPLGVTLNQLAPLTLMRIPARLTLPIERLSDNWGVLLHEPAQQKVSYSGATYPRRSLRPRLCCNNCPMMCSVCILISVLWRRFGWKRVLQPKITKALRWRYFGQSESLRRLKPLLISRVYSAWMQPCGPSSMRQKNTGASARNRCWADPVVLGIIRGGIMSCGTSAA